MNKILQYINSSDNQINVLIDLSNLLYRKAYGKDVFDELKRNLWSNWNCFYSTVIDALVGYKKMFKESQIILACDKKIEISDGNWGYWRNRFYSYYKGKRKKAVSVIPKDILLKEFKNITNVIKENLPWFVLEINEVEADDIIGVFCDFSIEDLNIIVSRDRDFLQLIKQPYNFLYDPKAMDFIEDQDIKYARFEHICKGDQGDSVPNILSPLDSYEKGIRCKQMRSKQLLAWYQILQDEGMKGFRKNVLSADGLEKRWIENRKLVDFDMIPNNIKNKVYKAYKEYIVKGSTKKFYEWCVRNNMQYLSETAVDYI